MSVAGCKCRTVHHDFDRCYRAVQSNDARFDGWFVAAVLTTGIYCRASCPARAPCARNVRFFATAAAAQSAGFRACRRCHPDASPGSPDWNVRSDPVARAMRLIADGTVEREGIRGLAVRLGYTTRQLQRLLQDETGAGPRALARAQRAQTARLLVEATALPFGDIAYAAGFSSIRQFNETLRLVYDTSTTELRKRATARFGPGRSVAPTPGTVSLRLAVRVPFAYAGVFGHLAASVVPGCEEVRDGAYRRTLRLPFGNGIVSLTPAPDHVRCTLALDDLRDLTSAIARCRRLLDLDADPDAVLDALSADAALAPVLATAPGQRIPRSVDEAELAVRTVLGQQVSVKAARTHAGRLVAAYGEPVHDADGALTHIFPSIEQLGELDPVHLAVPHARRRTLTALITGLAEGSVVLGAGCDWIAARRQLLAVPGIGPWTVEMIAMRGLGDPDAFPASDLGLRWAAEHVGLPTAQRDLIARSDRWRPWRSYATQHLWTTLEHPVNDWPPKRAA